MANPIHEALFEDMITSGKFSVHRPQDPANLIKYVCLTDKNSQLVGNRGNKRLCLILYGPGRNHPNEENTIIHARCSFVDDSYGKHELRGKNFDHSNYLLFEKLKDYLCLCPGKPDKQSTRPNSDEYKDPDKNWYFFCVKGEENWPHLTNTIREFNGLKL